MDLGVCEREELLDDDLDGGDVCVLGDVLVLHEALLCGPALAHVDAELDEAHKDGLEGREGRRPEALRGEHFSEGLERCVGLPDGDETLRLLQDCLWLRQRRHDGSSEKAAKIKVYTLLHCGNAFPFLDYTYLCPSVVNRVRTQIVPGEG